MIPGIEARSIPGLPPHRPDEARPRRRGRVPDLMWFDSLDAIKAFMGEDYSVSHVPPAARAVLDTLRRARRPLRSDRPPRAIAAKPRRVPVTRLALTDFRSYASALIEPGPGFVLLSGENGAGKTNLLEAVSLLTPGPRPARRGAVGNGAERRGRRLRRRRPARRRRHRHRHAGRRARAAAGADQRRAGRRSTRSANGCRCCG